VGAAAKKVSSPKYLKFCSPFNKPRSGIEQISTAAQSAAVKVKIYERIFYLGEEK
jgi:hypothetical protein